MEIKDYFEYQGNTIKEQIENLLKNYNYQDAIDLAKYNNLVDKEIEIYETILKNCGNVPEEAGERMEYYGLIKNAIKYYKINGPEDSKKRINELKGIINKSKKKFIESNRETYCLMDYSEEAPETWELLYKIKNNNKSAVEELRTGLDLDTLIMEMGGIGFLRN